MQVKIVTHTRPSAAVVGIGIPDGRPSIFKADCLRLAIWWCASKVRYGNYCFSSFAKPSSSKHTQVPLRDLGLCLTTIIFFLTLVCSCWNFLGRDWEGQNKERNLLWSFQRFGSQNQQVLAPMLIWSPGCLATVLIIYSSSCRLCCWMMSMDGPKSSGDPRAPLSLGMLQPLPFFRTRHCCAL